MKLYITRHGETEWNVQKRLQGWKDSPLTDLGRHHVELLGSRLGHLDFTEIYSSPSKRTLQTAEILKGSRQQRVVELEGLREINMGSWEGHAQEDIKRDFPEEYNHFWNAPHLFKRDEGEDFYTFQKRVDEVFDHIIGKQHQGNVLIVTHTVVIKAILARHKGLAMHDLWSMPYIYDSSLTVLEAVGGHVSVLAEGDMSHLEM